MKWQKKGFFILIATLMLFVMTATAAMAYFDRGPVQVSVGKNNVSIAAGKSTSVSVSASPSSDSQLPGCGMAECPQTCGEKNCLDANGQCMCNGTTYKTYYTDITTSSSNSSVAKASYSNGVLTIKGVSAGEADITVTAMLRQFTSTSQTIHVSVSASSAGSNSNQSNNSAVQPTNGSVEVVSETPQVDTNNEQNAESDEEITGEEDNYSINSDKGLIHFVAIKDGEMGKAEFQSVFGKDETVVFQKKDESESILYSWEFYGKDLRSAEDLDFSVATERQLPEDLKGLIKGDVLYLDFAHEGDLPGPSTLNVRVGDSFADDAVLNLYYFNPDTQQLELMAERLKIENGYVSFMLDSCSAYVLTDGELSDGAGFSLWLVLLIILIVVISIVAIIVIRGKKRKTV